MKANWDAGLKKLRRYAAKLRNAGAKTTMAELAENLAEECISLVLDGFDRERDPYGRKWAKRKPDLIAAQKRAAKRAEKQAVTISRIVDVTDEEPVVKPKRKRKKKRRRRVAKVREVGGVIIAPIVSIKRKRGKPKINDRPILIGETTRLRGGFHHFSSSNEFGVAASVEYGKYHQSGTKHMVARKMVPDANRRLPKGWAMRLTDVAEAFYESILGDD